MNGKTKGHLRKGLIFYIGTKQDYIRIILIALTLIFVMGMNLSLIFTLISSQTDEIGRIQLESIKGGLEGTIADAERIVMRVAIGSEQLSADKTKKELEKYIIDQKSAQVQVSNGGCFNIYIAGSDWQIIPDFDIPEDFHAAERIWYKGAAENYGDVFITEPYIDIVSGNVCFTVSTMLSDKDTVVAADFNFTKMQESVSQMTQGTDKTALIVTKKGMIVGYTDMSLVGENISVKLPEYQKIFERVVNSKEHPSFRVDLDGKSHTIFSSETKNQWYMILSVNDSALYKDAYKQAFINILLNLIIVVVIVIFYLMSVHNRIKSEDALAVKEEFLSSLSGELREPLRRVLKKCDNMLSENKGSAEDVTEIKESGIQLSEMLDNLFSFSVMVSDDKKDDTDSKTRIELPKASRLTRNAVIAVLIFALVSSQIICTRSAKGWGDSVMERETENYENQLSEWILQQQSILSMFTNMISEHPELMDDYDSAVKWLNDIVKNYPEISVCYMTNPYKEHTVIMNNGWQPDEDWKVEERQWYIDTEKSDDSFNISAPYYDEQTGNYCITFSQIVNGKNGEFLGIFGIDFFMDKLINVLGESYTPDGYAFLVDADGIIINHPNSSYQMSLDKTTSIEDTNYSEAYHGTKNTVLKDYNGRLMTCMSKKNKISNFTVIVVNRWWNVYANTVLFSILFLFLFGLCIAAVVMLINRLIVWQQQANRKLSEAADMALAAGKAQSQFMAQMSHEIRTPINAVLGMNEMILRESSDPEILDYSSNIQRAGKTLLNLINSILDYSKMESGKMEIIQTKYNTVPLINDLVYMIRERALKKGLELKTQIDPKLPNSLYGDELRIKQIITNILTNAVKYTHEGSVTLVVGGRETGENSFELYVEVRDTGIGIRKEDMDNLFRSFKRLDEEKNRNIEGTGLGISIVQKLLNMMGSSLEVQSEYGKGSVFSFRLEQRIIDKTQIGEYHMGKTETANEKSLKKLCVRNADILVVDDNDMNLKVAKGLMKRCGIVPDICESGEECIRKVYKKHYDIVFLDHMMPVMDGIETFRKLRDGGYLDEDTVVIVLTANAVSGARENYIKEGFKDYLSKPIEVSELENMLVKYLPKEKVSFTEENDAPKEKAAPLDRLAEGGINTKAGMEYSADSEEFYFEMLTAFAEGAKEKSADIRRDFETENWKDYRTRVHALKSTAKMIGADKLSAAALAQENAAKDERADEIHDGYPKLDELYKQTVDIIQEVLNDKGNVTNSENK